MYKTTLYLVLLFLMFTSCSNKTNSLRDEIVNIEVDINDLKIIKMEDIFSSIELIALENLDTALFNKCDKMNFSGNKYYILDKKSLTIFVFDQYGRFLRSSRHKNGNGFGEYYYIGDFEILDNEIIEILDVSAYKIRRYDDNFDYIGELTIPKEIYPISTFKRLTDELYIFYRPSFQGDTDKISICSLEKGTVLKSLEGYVNTPSLRKNYTQFYSFYESGKDLFFSFPYPNDKIYRTNYIDNEIKEVVNYDFGKYNFPYSKADNYQTFFNDIMKGSDKYVFPTHRYENEMYIFTFVLHNEKQNLVLYEKHTGETTIYSCSLKNGKILLPPALVDDNFFYIVSEPSWLEHVTSDNLLSEKDKEVFNHIKEEDNCIIIKYKLSQDHIK